MELAHQWSKLPQDIVFNVVSNLQIKPLYRFKLVSKSWLAFINNLIVSGIKNKPQKVIFTSKTCLCPFYTLDSQSHRDLVEIRNFSEKFCFRIKGSCNGVLLLRSYTNFLLWNPLTRKHRLIEPPDCEYMCLMLEGLSYDFVTKDFKVVIVASSGEPFADNHVYVFSSVSSSWKRIKDFRNGYSMDAQEPVVFNGSPYWIMRWGNSHVILHFDPCKDKFEELPVPSIGWVHSLLKLTILGGDLCAVNDNNINNTVDVWLVNDSSWHKLFVVPVPRRIGEFSARMLTPLCFVGKDGLNDEVVIRVDSRALALFNLKKKTLEMIELPSECASFTLACYEETIASP